MPSSTKTSNRYMKAINLLNSRLPNDATKNEKLKKNITTSGFKYSNPSAKAVGLGNYYGTIQQTPFRHETDFIVPRKGEAPPHHKAQARPIYTQPTKRGTFGFPNTTISKIGTDYIASFYGQERSNAAKDREASQKLIKGAPFRPSGRSRGTFDEGEATGVSTCFMMTKPMAPRKVKPLKVYKKQDQPWRPCGQVDQIIKVEYREDPYDKFDPRVGVKKKGHKASAPSDRASWKPNSSTDNFWYSCSIAFKRL